MPVAVPFIEAFVVAVGGYYVIAQVAIMIASPAYGVGRPITKPFSPEVCNEPN
jgi:hypothetical protein